MQVPRDVAVNRDGSARQLEAGHSEHDNLKPTPMTAPRSIGRRAWLALGAGCALVILGGTFAWTFHLRDRVIPKRFGVVVAGSVYRSGQISESLIEQVIDRYGLGTIIDLNGLEPQFAADQNREMAVARRKGLEHDRFPLSGDGTGRIERYAEAIAAIVRSERNKRPVLVHCASGSQRTGACIAFYRLLVKGQPSPEVYRELQQYGWSPTRDRILLEYINGHMRELANLLVQRRVLAEAPQTLPVLHP